MTEAPGLKDRVTAFLHGPGQGILTVADLRALHVGPAVLRTLVREGVIVRIVRGLYVLAALLDPPPEEVKALGRAAVVERGHLLLLDALLRAYGPGMAASHQTAALAWGMPVLLPTLDRVRLVHTRIGATGRRHERFTTHRCEHEDAFTRHQGRRLVLPHVAVLGTAVRYGVDAGLVAADGALRARLTTRSDLEEWLTRWRHHPGLSTARAVVELADGSADSPGESLLRRILVGLGIRFQAQHWIRAENGRFYRVDFYLPDLGVVLEFDGKVKYGDRNRPEEGGHDGEMTVVEEKVREDAIRALGYGVGRVIWSGLAEEKVQAVIRTAAGQAQPQALHRPSCPPHWAR
ncbi:type IV toxin-antitoxin system AbiEi family antitoxin domain-containing protein [Ornithinimicrobium tianjinense]|uniref:AbiEi antitoxin N-terminal domain-containing protein n=1 Tax=Ornithinimicrobium tianjinense TaxID=1195761 RepID=A0A917BPF3_9MICO|nr:type IV toxin-antitoxin system AbiEi family antitoxin domain-containing protein [Ornithinimicrobium tianjinense]GGF51927.1 hypothetical protein GCM10011366_19750 [Ornithinimicrobium tianjinense]